ncbi:hypothetical protein D3C83_34690 [compost metagenome]
MVQSVGEDGVFAPHQRRHRTEVGQITGRKQQRARQAGERRQPPLQFVMCRGMAEDQVGCAGSDAKTRRAFARRLDQFGMGGKTEIIVAAERGVLAATNRDARALG